MISKVRLKKCILFFFKPHFGFLLIWKQYLLKRYLIIKHKYVRPYVNIHWFRDYCIFRTLILKMYSIVVWIVNLSFIGKVNIKTVPVSESPGRKLTSGLVKAITQPVAQFSIKNFNSFITTITLCLYCLLSDQFIYLFKGTYYFILAL